MAKRSNFDRRVADAYQTTDPRGVAALLPYLINVRTFAEPCCGEGHLIKELERHEISCRYAADLDMGIDACGLKASDIADCDAIITNPPWTRNLLHPLITVFMRAAPTWLLFDSDWAYNRHARFYLPHCTHIVAVGRLIWMPGTAMSGKDNCSWYRFVGDHTAGPHFYGRT